MNEKKLGKVLKDAANNNKIKTGFKEVSQYIKGTKLMVISKSLPEDSEEKLRRIAEEIRQGRTVRIGVVYESTLLPALHSYRHTYVIDILNFYYYSKFFLYIHIFLTFLGI